MFIFSAVGALMLACRFRPHIAYIFYTLASISGTYYATTLDGTGGWLLATNLMYLIVNFIGMYNWFRSKEVR